MKYAEKHAEVQDAKAILQGHCVIIIFMKASPLPQKLKHYLGNNRIQFILQHIINFKLNLVVLFWIFRA